MGVLHDSLAFVLSYSFYQRLRIWCSASNNNYLWHAVRLASAYVCVCVPQMSKLTFGFGRDFKFVGKEKTITERALEIHKFVYLSDSEDKATTLYS